MGHWQANRREKRAHGDCHARRSAAVDAIFEDVPGRSMELRGGVSQMTRELRADIGRVRDESRHRDRAVVEWPAIAPHTATVANTIVRMAYAFDGAEQAARCGIRRIPGKADIIARRAAAVSETRAVNEPRSDAAPLRRGIGS
jgi:hypothetical protein